MKSHLGLVVLLVLAMVPMSAYADTFGFQCITNNSTTDCGIGAAQLSVDVTAYGTGQVLFEFSNAGPLASSITDVYFDDGTLLGISSIINQTGVSFAEGASPSDLPGGNAIGFETTAGFLADSDSPIFQNGVNPNESLGIVFDLINGQDFDDILAALQQGAGTGGLRIGIHVQGFDGGGSESFVNGGTPVPEPSTLLLLGSSLGLAGLLFRKRAK